MRSLIQLTPTLLSAFLALGAVARGHDTWVETNNNVVRAEEQVFVQLFLGNHGNDHRDFKVAGKADPDASTLQIIAPGGASYDLKERWIDNGYAPAEGFWSARFVPTAAGLYLVAHTYDKVVTYAPQRTIKSAKCCFVVSQSLDQVPRDNPGFDRVLGHALEIVPTANPVTPMGPGGSIELRVLFEGQPLPEARVSFIPRGETLREDFDDRYERTTDQDGRANFVAKEGNVYLVIVHHLDPGASGPGYKSTKYSASLTVYVPQTCPCCEK